MKQANSGAEFNKLQEWLQTIISANQFGSATGNTWVSNAGSDKIISTSPINTEHLGTVTAATSADITAVINAATQEFAHWRNIPAPVRGQFIAAIGKKLKEHKNMLGSLIAAEMGKLKTEGDGEVQEMIDMAEFAVGQSRMLYGKTMPSERPQHRLMEQWQPLGAIAVVTAFNFPMAVWAWNAFIAAVCGNTVIWKPSPKTPISAIAVHHLCQEVMEELGYDNIFSLCITGETKLIKELITAAQLPLVSFTGSSAIGKLVAAKTGKQMRRTILECGGNNAMIVSAHADIEMAAQAATFSAIGTTGQRCTSLRRCYVHSSIYKEFQSRILEKYSNLVVGNPLESSSSMGPLVDTDAVALFNSTVQQAKATGGELIFGGKQIPGLGECYVEPTIIACTPSLDLLQHENFVPILYLCQYEKFSEAIELQNNVPQGLSSALFSTNIKEIEKFLSASGSDCGIANINVGTTGAEIGGAFGGEKETGGGREAGSDAWKGYMRRQTVTINGSTALPLAQGVEFEP